MKNSLTNGQPIQLQGAEGMIFKFTASTYLEQAYQWAVTGSTITAWAASVFTAMKLSQDTNGKNVAATKEKL